MILEEILMADCTGILLMVILLVNRYLVRSKKRASEDKFFNALVVIGFLGCGCELLAFLIDGKPGIFLNILNISVNLFIYVCTTTISVVWLWYVDTNLNHNPKRIRTIFLPFVIAWAILVIMLFVNAFAPFLFEIDDSNVYHRMPLGYIYYGFLFLCFFTTIIIYIRDRIKHGETKFFPIFMFLIPVILACVIQALWYGIAAAWLGCAIGLTAIYLNIQSRFALIDGLTGLYNRAFIEHKLIVARRKSNKFAYCGIMLDIDYFKQINDTYGHSAGDKALRHVSRILLEASDRKTLMFRVAGDEFFIFLKSPIEEKNSLEEKMFLLESRIREEAEKFNKSGDVPYQLNFSFGEAVFDSSLSDDDFFREMDTKMYKEKKQHHQIMDKHMKVTP